ncbi:MAG: sialate O-acetylesterase, partial [Gemmataceae bacterium]
GDGKPVPGKLGDLYDTLMARVRSAVGDKQPDSICFVWMQGERDAKEMHDAVYAASMQGLIEQLRGDLKRKDVYVVIGRLSDNLQTPNWEAVRKAQVQVAERDPLAGWVDTDDLNGPNDGLHYTKDGYKELGDRFAKKAIALLAGSKK